MSLPIYQTDVLLSSADLVTDFSTALRRNSKRDNYFPRLEAVAVAPRIVLVIAMRTLRVLSDNPTKSGFPSSPLSSLFTVWMFTVSSPPPPVGGDADVGSLPDSLGVSVVWHRTTPAYKQDQLKLIMVAVDYYCQMCASAAWWTEIKHRARRIRQTQRT